MQQLDAVVEVWGTVEARKVDALSFGTDHVLELGRASATLVEIGHPGSTEHPELGETRIKGQFKAEQASDLQGDVLIRGTATAQGQLWASSLVVPGTATIEALSGNTVGVSTVNASRVNATSGVNSRVLVSQDGLICPSIAELKAEGCFHYVRTSVRSDRNDSPALAVEHLTQNNSQAALHVVNNSMLAQGTGGFFHAPRAIVAEGQVQINGTAVLSGEGLVLLAEGEVQLNSRAVLNGETLHASPVRMQGQPIIMGGEGESEVKMIAGDKRLEFYIGDKMRFYIDESGGHNA